MKLTGLEAKVVRALLQYLYTGKCCFALEDLNLGVEVCLTEYTTLQFVCFCAVVLDDAGEHSSTYTSLLVT